MFLFFGKVSIEQLEKTVKFGPGCGAGIDRVLAGKTERLGFEMIDRLEDQELIKNLDEIFPISPGEAVFAMEKMFVDQREDRIDEAGDFRRFPLGGKEKAAFLGRRELGFEGGDKFVGVAHIDVFAILIVKVGVLSQGEHEKLGIEFGVFLERFEGLAARVFAPRGPVV